MIIFQKSDAELNNLDEKSLCMSFLNTANWHASQNPVEELESYADLVNWGRGVGLISAGESGHLLVRARQDPAAAGKALQDARFLREAIFRMVLAQSRGRRYDPADLDQINAFLGEGCAHLKLFPSESGFTRGWEADPIDLDLILWPVVQSAADLMASPEMAYAKICADDRGCGYAFLDLSRNHNRRWCSMDSCGNRAKAQRHYHRGKQQ